MTFDQEWKLRLEILTKLVQCAPQAPGRTALMKFAYLLQVCRNVPLGYEFRLYSYGPYDNAVLSDLSHADSWKMIKSRMVRFPNGNIGHRYTPHKGYTSDSPRLSSDAAQYESEISWVLDHFGKCTAAELELISTIVFADQEMRRKSDAVCRQELCRTVHAIKPHFEEETINQNIDRLQELDLLGTVTTAGSEPRRTTSTR